MRAKATPSDCPLFDSFAELFECVSSEWSLEAADWRERAEKFIASHTTGGGGGGDAGLDERWDEACAKLPTTLFKMCVVVGGGIAPSLQ